MVELAVDVDHGAVRAFQEALGQLGASLGSAASTAPRRAAIMVCKSLKAGTTKARKNRSMTARTGASGPKWITYRDGKKLDKPLRRWTVSLSDRGRTFDRFVYADGTARQQLRSQVGTNYYPTGSEGSPQHKGGTRGLAKRSWGWVMHNIYSGASPDTPWTRRKNDRRNPKDATKDSCSVSSQNASVSFGMARICNRLSYIRDALKVSPEAALEKAAKRIVGTLATRRLKSSGMSSQEIREEAKRITEDFIRRFPMQDNLPGFL